jgi:quercetin dioxygenase-like cupin family protein
MSLEQPVEIIEEALGFCTRTVTLNIGTSIPQHAHTEDHATLVCNGSVQAWVEGKNLGHFEAGQLIGVKAGKEHTYLSLSENTRLSCIFFDKSRGT